MHNCHMARLRLPPSPMAASSLAPVREAVASVVCAPGHSDQLHCADDLAAAITQAAADCPATSDAAPSLRQPPDESAPA